jgi:formylglycine-generating enzyme required for sulfatase activity
VTQGEFAQVMGANPSQMNPRKRPELQAVDTTRLPVDSVLWSEAVEFCRRLSARAEEQAAGRSYRLPTEAEWEYACRAGSMTPYNIGDRLGSADANFKAAGLPMQAQRTMAVGSFRPNAFGLFDMHGNVEEWCSDYYDYGYYRYSPTLDPPGPATGVIRVSRSGSYMDAAEDCRSARRLGRVPDVRNIALGFRVVCETSPSAAAAGAVAAQTPLWLGMRLEAEWNGTWWPAEVMEVRADGQVKIHYVNFGSNWDEVVPRSRLRFPR